MTAAAADAPVLRLHGITKRFGTLTANDGLSLTLYRGEVLALLGENGAGKSTLMSILFGQVVPDSGHIEAFGRPLPPGDTRAARAAGIGMVHQHFTLAENLSVLDNVMLGREPLWRPRARRAAARAALLATAERFGLSVRPDARVADLSVGERQRVEILKALVPAEGQTGARILILDEPTAVLTPAESASLFRTLAQLVAEGLGVVFISHKLDEVLRVSDRIAVLRQGRLVATLRAGDTDARTLAGHMVGRAVAPVTRTPRPPGALVCRLAAATVRGAGARPLLDRIDLDVHAGELVGIAGVSGNGQQALAEVLHGQRGLDGGTLTVQGRSLPARPAAWIVAGLSRIPEDRQGTGAVGDLSVWENAVIERHASPAFARFGTVRRRAAVDHARSLVERFDVRGLEAGGLAMPVRRLSGGNLQKLIVGRALSVADGRTPGLVVANQPTWGLDVGAVAYVHRQLLAAVAQGAAVLVISDDLDELFALADRLAVMRQGRLSAARPAADWSLDDIGLAMSGGVQGRAQGGPQDDQEAAHAA